MTLLVELTATRFASAPNTASHRGALAAVVHRRRGAVRVQVVHLLEPRAGVAERLAHRLDRPVARRMRVGDAVAPERVAVAGQLGVDPRAAPARRLPLLEDEEAGALAEHEAVARRVERAARALGRLVVRRDRAQQAEARRGRPG